ncbi:MAG: DUF3126 family protein [Hyphomonadaceae bacterium]
MNQAEIARLEAYLRRVFASAKLSVAARNDEEGELRAGGKKIADITKEEDEGETSYFVNLGVSRAPGAAKDAPIEAQERARLETVLRQELGAAGLEVRARPRKTDSAEVYVGEEFIGAISRDEESREFGYFLTMSILDIDLED